MGCIDAVRIFKYGKDKGDSCFFLGFPVLSFCFEKRLDRLEVSGNEGRDKDVLAFVERV